MSEGKRGKAHGRRLSEEEAQEVRETLGFTSSNIRQTTIRECIDFLMSNAGNYCSCQNAPDYLMCSKHAQTHAASILENQFFPKLSKADHACSTGDCDHSLQRQCDEALAKEYDE